MNVSVVVTVRNEGGSISALLDSLAAQLRLADEVIICDGGSSDKTVQIIQDYAFPAQLSVVAAPGSNISEGRNRAIEAANGPIIAVTDAGVVLAPDWLEELTQPFESEGASLVSGWFRADPRTRFETVMGATVLPALTDIDGENFLPSSRSVAFLKSAWQEVGGYPEWLDFGEDLVFDMALVERFGQFTFAPGAVAHFRPRGSLRSYARQYYLYARGDGRANLWPLRHAIRYFTYLLILPAILALIAIGYWPVWLLLIVGLYLYCRRPLARLLPLMKGWSLPARLWAITLVPLLRLVGDVSKMVGYPAGWLRRWRESGSEND